MDIERVNSTLVEAIIRLQEREIEGLSRYDVRSPRSFGFDVPKFANPQNIPGARDETKEALSKALYAWRDYGFHDKRFGGAVKAAKKKLNKSQQAVVKLIGKGIDLPLISNVLLFADEFHRLKKNERKALLSLVMAGRFKLWRLPGRLPGEHRPSKVGAFQDWHFRLVPAR